jgi:hypothetical protein
MILELLGGPLNGVIHEIHDGFLIPDALALPDEGKLHWYVTGEDQQTATYHHSEIKDP